MSSKAKLQLRVSEQNQQKNAGYSHDATDEPPCSEEDTSSKIPTEVPKETNKADIMVDIKEKPIENKTQKIETKTTPEETDSAETKEKTEVSDDGEPKFGSAKEKECWNMYCKMADRGLKVSYDTILRGMLTPTEYRMRRRESITPVTEETAPQ